MANRGNEAETRYLATALEKFQKEAVRRVDRIVGVPTNQDGTESVQDEHNEGEETKSICKKHNVPLNFWSNKEQVYQCIKCLINEEEVHYIDDSYKKHLDDFRAIRSYGMSALTENTVMAQTLRDWKDDIRDILQRVQQELLEMINEFTKRFQRSLMKIEQSEKLMQYQNEDFHQARRLEYMQDRYENIDNLIKKIEATAPNLRAQVTREIQPEMKRLETEMIAKDKEMRKINQKIERAMKETVDVSLLSARVFQKY